MLLGMAFGLAYAHAATLELMGLVPVSFFAAGKFLPLWGITDQSSFSPWQLGIVIWVMDTYSVIIVVYGLEGLYRFGALKRGLNKMQRNAALVIRAYPRVRRATTMGVIAFVLFPIAGTGALAGAFLGVLLGMNRFVLIAAISCGGLLGGMLMAGAAVAFGDAMLSLRQSLQEPITRYITIAVVVLVLILSFRALGRAYRRALTLAEHDDSRSDEKVR